MMYAASGPGVEGHMQQAALQSGSAAHQLQQLRADNMSSPAGVRQRIAELEAKAPAEVKSRFDAATLALRDVLPAVLLSHALPAMPEDSQARSEAIGETAMLLAGKSGAALTMAMAQLAGGSNRRLAAVVAGTWGYARLGGDATQHEAVRMNALQGSLVHGTA